MITNDSIIISGANKLRFDSHINHKKWADKKKIDYHFYINTDLPNPYFTKCHAILDCFDKGYNKVLWVDDDVFFINDHWNIEQYFSSYAEDIMVTQGRTNKKSGTTLFNNGIMFIKKSSITEKIFSAIPQITSKEMKQSWKKDWGPLEGNDQPRMIYYTQKYYYNSVKILPYPGFNAHEITFKQRKNFLHTHPPFVHITGQNKEAKIKRFQEVTGISLP